MVVVVVMMMMMMIDEEKGRGCGGGGRGGERDDAMRCENAHVWMEWVRMGYLRQITVKGDRMQIKGLTDSKSRETDSHQDADTITM
eukprot:2201569-Rhodomonas_salina.2